MPGRRKKPTITSTSELATHLGLSRWTVSRVINDHPDVKEETRQKVLQAMEELHFSPSIFARGLRGGKTNTIGVCFREVDNPILARKIACLQSLLRQRGYRSLIELTEGDPQLEADAVRHFITLRVEAIVLVGSSEGESSALQLLKESGIPGVLVDPLAPVPDLPGVELDRPRAMRLILEHLLGLGHRKFALLGISSEVPYGRPRLKTLASVAAEHHLSFEKDFEIFTTPDPQGYGYAYGRCLAQLLIDKGTDATALIALDDLIALGAMRRLQEHGFTIPADFSIVGFDNIDITEHTTPRLSTVDQQVKPMIEAAIVLLYHQMEDDLSTNGRIHTRIEPELVLRESTTQPHDRRTSQAASKRA
jgi:DNA-binding LacI/PurR family transcriptional regulator